jgi:DNA primase
VAISLADIKIILKNYQEYSTYIAAICPFHDDSHPSMMVYSDHFYCKACNANGSLDKLRDQLTHFTVSELKSKFGKKVDFRNPLTSFLDGKTASDFAYEANENIRKHPGADTYLKKRKIDHLIDELTLGYWQQWYIFPVRDEYGDIVNVVARANESIQEAKQVRYIVPNGSDPMLYVPSWKSIRKADKVYVVYGIIDAITLYSLGFPVVTGINGKFSDPDLLSRIRKPIIIVPDQGEETDAVKLAARLSWRGNVHRLQYPDGTKDPSDIYMRFGSQRLSTALAY